MSDVVKSRAELISDAALMVPYIRRTLDTVVADYVQQLVDALAVAPESGAARLRDLEFPEGVPESVTDAAYASQADWWTPGLSAVQPVLMPSIIESVAEAAYKATRVHLAGEGEKR